MEPAYEPTVVRLIEQIGLAGRVTFAEVPRDELRQRYLDADCLVFPSAWDEPFGLVPVEAMACGTPVVATGTGGSAEFLRDEVNCLLFPARDDEALASRVLRLSEDAALRDRLVEGGLALASELSVDRLAETFEAWHVAAAAGFVAPLPANRVLPGAPRRPT
jgi:glycosyltransferase involved in cell wall biosynthesis